MRKRKATAEETRVNDALAHAAFALEESFKAFKELPSTNALRHLHNDAARYRNAFAEKMIGAKK